MEENKTNTKSIGILKKLFIWFIILASASIGQIIGKEFINNFLRNPPPAFSWQSQIFDELEFESPLLLKPETISKNNFAPEIANLIESLDSKRSSDNVTSIGISYIGYKDGVSVNLEKALMGSLQSSAKSMNPNANPEFTKNTFKKNGIDGFIGSYVQTWKGTTFNFKGLVFLKGQKMYNVIFIWSPGRASDEDVNRFFDSIKFTVKPLQDEN